MTDQTVQEHDVFAFFVDQGNHLVSRFLRHFQSLWRWGTSSRPKSAAEGETIHPELACRDFHKASVIIVLTDLVFGRTHYSVSSK